MIFAGLTEAMMMEDSEMQVIGLRRAAPSPRPAFGVLAAGALITLLASLSVHALMLNILHVPFPAQLPSGGWSRFPDRWMSVGGAVAVLLLLPPSLQKKPWLLSAPLLCVLLLTVNEDLIRGPIMDIVTADRWTVWPFADALPQDVKRLIVTVLLVACLPILRSVGGAVIVSAVVAAVVYLLLSPQLPHIFSDLTAWTHAHEGRTIYSPPYDWHVEVPAYATFIEPVAACICVCALIRPRLAVGELKAFIQLAVVLFMLRGQLFTAFTYGLATTTPYGLAMASFGQFTLESLVLAVLSALTWTLAVHQWNAPGLLRGGFEEA